MSRLDLRERRVDMRQQHGLVRSLEAQILRHWQKDVSLINQDAIHRLHGELCAALDKLGPMEEDYDEKEDVLDTLEFDLEIKEKRFYRQHSRSASEASFGSPSTRRTSVSTLSHHMDIHTSDHQDFLSPEYQYYSRVGDAKIVRERLMELEAQKIQYLDIKRGREALSIPLYPENVDFLSNYNNEYAEHLEELGKIEKDIQSLGIQAGLFNTNDVLDTAAIQAVREAPEIKAPMRRGSPATEPGKSGRLELPVEEVLRRKSEADIWEIPNDPRSTRERINQWILERLQDSKLEEARHRAILDDPELDRNAWWHLVLKFWQMDRAARSSKSSSRQVSGASTSAKSQVLQGSLDLALDEASNHTKSSRQRFGDMSPALPVTTFTWPQDVLRDRDIRSADLLGC
ncbi:MAG: hypothetical protein Q9225_002764 [Loekoesia sp. 1 TL-2023]